ncbi:MAG TPA: DNA ligase D, partial [Candidatus Binatia bacterium]|nr:DNA ligase D [Candidatus Binatia bacterium]
QPPMLATLVDEPFSGPEWLFEVKYDGVRVLAEREGERVSLWGRHGQEFTVRYPEVVEALRALPLDRFVLDGEVVAFDAAGRTSFQRLQARMHVSRPADVAVARRQVPVQAVFFDALGLAGRDLRDLPLSERKALLALVLPRRDTASYGDHVLERGEDLFAACTEKGLEGIVAKRIASRYTGGRTRDWLKIKCQRRQEFVIGGYTDPQGARPYFGALHLGVYDDQGRLVYVSKVGTGFDARSLRQLWERLQPLRRRTSPFDVGTPTGRGHHWVEPRLVAEVRFTEWTEDGGLRHPAFLGLRDDKRPEECRRERPAPAPAGTDAANGSASAAPARRVVIKNARKVFWPAEGYTKGDLVAYYEAVAPLLLPYLRDRPLVLVRYPDGIEGKSFFQKDAPPSTPSWLRTARIPSADPPRDIDYLLVDDVEGLRWVVNLGTIPIHIWASRAGSLDRPDWLVLDLDPKEAPFRHVVRVALVLRELLDTIEVPSFPKTSGKTGLHVLVPLGARYSYADTRAFGELVATLAVEREPRLATVARPLRERGGRVYVDFGQNAPGQTIVAPFAVRPLPGAPVSCPLTWDEVDNRLDPRRFTIRTVLPRFATLPDPMAPVLGPGIDLPLALRRLEERLGRLRPKAATAAGRRGRGRGRTPRA